MTCDIGIVKWKGCLLHTSGPWAFYDTCQWGLLLVHTGVSSFLNLCHYVTVTEYNFVNCTVFCFSAFCMCVFFCVRICHCFLNPCAVYAQKCFWKHCISNVHKRAQASIIFTNCAVCVLLGSGSYTCFHCILQLWPRRGDWGDLSTSLWPREYHPVYGVDGRWPHSSTYTKVRYSLTPDSYVFAL